MGQKVHWETASQVPCSPPLPQVRMPYLRRVLIKQQEFYQQIYVWLYGVTSNLCIDRLRKLNRNSGDEVPEVADETSGIDR